MLFRSFCSGVGGWSTDMRILADGSFTGDFHDSEMGDAADNYPDGTVYYCTFSGKFSLVSQENENIWKVKVDALKQAEKPGTEEIEDGIRYVAADSVYGLTEGDEMLLYAPGTSLDTFTEEMKLWAHVFDLQEKPVTMQEWFLYSPAYDTGFVGYQAIADDATIADPWETLTAEQLKALTGLPLNLPEGAEQPVYRWYRGDSIAEMQFTWKSGDYVFRARNTLPDENVRDITGMYFTWENQKKISVNGCDGTIGMAQTGIGTTAEFCTWYDESRKTLYSLTVVAPDTDGLDLPVIAEKIISAK